MFQVKEKKPKREKRRKKDKAAAIESAAENMESGAASAEEEQVKQEPFLKRLLFGEPKPDLSELESGSTTILDILSPTMVDTKSRDYIIVDSVYHAYLIMNPGFRTKKWLLLS